MQWVKPPIDGSAVRTLAASYNLDLLTASILTRRDFISPEQLAFFLEKDERFLHNALVLPGMEEAVDRVLAAAEEGEKVLICGDKDADGITSTVLMVEALRMVGLDPEWRVPVGEEDYGLNPEVLREKAGEDFTLVITVDCGVTNFLEIDLAVELGMDVLVFDHHSPREEGGLPNANVIVNPKVFSGYPFDGLCAVALASKFQWALSLSQTEIWGQEFVLLLARKDEDSIVIEAALMRNLMETGRISVSSDRGEADGDKLLKFIEGYPLFSYGERQQNQLISSFFGGADVHMVDIAPRIAEAFPSFRGRSLEELRKGSRLARYFPDMDSELSVLSNLMVTLQSRGVSEAFESWRKGLDLVALGTLADLMPLRNENRILVRMGLARLNGSDSFKERRGALRALLIKQRLHEGRIGATEVAWQLCPLVNASGRMGRADLGVRFFLETDEVSIASLAEELMDLNKERRALGEALWNQVQSQAYASLEDLGGRMLIVQDEKVPRGIAGILAARLHKTMEAASVVISLRENDASGSIRCDTGMSALDWLEAMAPLLDDFGGHPQAGGFRISRERLSELVNHTKEWLKRTHHAPMESQRITIDAELSHEEISRLGPQGLEKLLEGLEPYGMGFAPIIFLTRSVRVHQAQLVGKPKNNHLKLLVSLGDQKWPALWWDGAEHYGIKISRDTDVDLVYRLDRDRWRGADAWRLTVLEASPCIT